MDLLIRFAKMEDAEELLALYTPYVTDTVITFEYEVPSLEEFKDRMRQTMRSTRIWSAEQNGEILGYSCAGAFKGRAAYDWAVETTIYIRKDRQKTGVGKKLYEALEKVLHAQNICNLYACIGYPEIEDKYLTKNSAQSMHILDTVWWENSIIVDTNLTVGIIWSGWKSFWIRRLNIQSRQMDGRESQRSWRQYF